MRGLRSFGGLLVVLLALGAYLYFVESKRPAGGDVEKKDKAFAVEADKVEEFTIKSESGEHTTVRKNGSRLADRAAGRRQAGLGGGLGRHVEPGVARDPARDRREPRGSRRVRPGAAPRRGGVQGRGQGSHAADRPQDAAGQRPLRAHRRSEAGRADPVVRRHHVQPHHLRPARQGGPVGQSRRDWLAHGRRRPRARCASRRPPASGRWRNRWRRGPTSAPSKGWSAA